MSTVKERARQNQCMTNLQQIAVGVQLFKQDNRRYPAILGSEVYGPADASGVRKRYLPSRGEEPEMFENVKDAYLFAEYVKTIGGFHCSTAPTLSSKDVAVYDITSPGDSDTPGLAVYAYNSYDCFVFGPGSAVGGHKEYTELTGNAERRYFINWAPSATDVAGLSPYPPSETDTAAIQAQDYARQLRFRNPPGDTVVTWCSYHEGVAKDGKSLVVFLDGHAASYPARELVQCKWRVRPRKS
jgi:hypothetical protein